MTQVRENRHQVRSDRGDRGACLDVAEEGEHVENDGRRNASSLQVITAARGIADDDTLPRECAVLVRLNRGDSPREWTARRRRTWRAWRGRRRRRWGKCAGGHPDRLGAP